MTTETLRPLLASYITDEEALNLAFSAPDTDLFTLGLDSIAAFGMLDDLATAGIDLEFTELVANPTVTFLQSRMN